MAAFAANLVLDELVKRVNDIIDDLPTADEKITTLRTRPTKLQRGLVALDEHVDPTHEEALEQI